MLFPNAFVLSDEMAAVLDNLGSGVGANGNRTLVYYYAPNVIDVSASTNTRGVEKDKDGGGGWISANRISAVVGGGCTVVRGAGNHSLVSTYVSTSTSTNTPTKSNAGTRTININSSRDRNSTIDSKTDTHGTAANKGLYAGGGDVSPNNCPDFTPLAGKVYEPTVQCSL
jgi:hypothetical protein